MENYRHVRLVMLCGPKPKATLVRMLTTALSGIRPNQREDYADSPDYYIEGSVLRWENRIRCYVALCSMENYTVLTGWQGSYHRSLSADTIAQDTAGHLWAIAEANGLLGVLQ